MINISLLQVKLNLNVIENCIVLFSKKKLLRGTLFHPFYVTKIKFRSLDNEHRSIRRQYYNVVLGFHGDLCIDSRSTTHAKWKWSIILARFDFAKLRQNCVRVWNLNCSDINIKIFFFYFETNLMFDAVEEQICFINVQSFKLFQRGEVK